MRFPGIWLILFTEGLACSALCQGLLGTVNVNNNFVPSGGSQKAFAGVLPGIPLAKAVGRVEVLDQAGAVISSVKDGTGNSFGADGLFFLGQIEIPGTVPGGSGTIFIRVWDKTSGNTYATASQRLGCIVTLSNLGGGLIPTPSLGACSNFIGLSPISWVYPPDIAVETAEDGRWRIFTKGPIFAGFVLHSSSDLADWSRGEFGHVVDGVMEWRIPDQGEAMFFRISQ